MRVELIGAGDSFCLSSLALSLEALPGLRLDALLGMTFILLGFTFTWLGSTFTWLGSTFTLLGLTFNLLGLSLGNMFLWTNNNCSVATKCSRLLDFSASNFNLS